MSAARETLANTGFMGRNILFQAMRIAHLLIAVAACTCGWIVLTLSSSAQNPPGPNFLENPPPEVLSRFDTDGDGKLDAEEKQAARAEIRDRFGAAGGPPRGPGGRGREEIELLDDFDEDGSGFLETEEREKAREHLKKERAEDGGGRRGPGGRRGGRGQTTEAPTPGAKVSPDDVEHLKGIDFYDTSIIRTLFFEFDSDDWEQEMEDFYRTDVLVPAKLTVDGKKLKKKVGVGFRGNSSFFTVEAGSKRSLDVRIDAIKGDQRLRGYKTLNLLSSHADPSFVREALYSRIAGNYMAAPKVNFVKVVINGENWGIYVNSQQFNNDFLEDWFDTRKGVRWKVPSARGSGAGLVYHGDDEADYSVYKQKSDKKDTEALGRLIHLCKILHEVPNMEPDKIEAALAPVLDVDSALWFLAIDRVFLDGDGYLSRGSDFAMYEDSDGRFHLLPHDSNESFRQAGAGGPGLRGRRGPGGPGGQDRDRGPRGERPERQSEPASFSVGPLDGADDERTPLLRALMSSPRLKARYLAHVRTLTNEWLDWEKTGPAAQEYHDLIAEEVAKDTKKLYSTEAFQNSLEGEPPTGRRAAPPLKTFITERYKALSSHPDLTKPVPKITNNDPPESPAAGSSIKISVTTSGTRAETVLLHYKVGKSRTFVTAPMEGNGTYTASIPGQLAGAPIAYYIEALTAGDSAAAFLPDAGAAAPFEFQVAIEKTATSPLVINEIVSSNKNINKDPQGKYEDWIELHNTGDTEIVLDGYCLTDNMENLRKWPFPAGTKIAAKGYLIVWADEDGKDEGLHANFKLSKDGEKIVLSNPDKAPIDIVEFEKIGTDESYARKPDSPSEWEIQLPSPGKRNR